MRQRCRILDRRDLDRLAVADDDRVALDLHRCRELAVDRIVAQQMGVGLDRAEIVDGDDFDVGAAGFDDGAKDVAADAAETVDGNLDCHVHSLPIDRARCEGWMGVGERFRRTQASFASAAATTASAVMPKCL